ncbi:adenylate/guanylate cyclase domain-containing protein [Mycobacterium sp. EPa45]|uniref:adenylate/guanylate cyclase domain-containing protein n=1 Tax=Mycobacterium sp. EPa45 TaxID=1545728 RepID=UPI00064281B1|nr:adenylate/guanylate cyclase domain-containing protein [Mycobacterium sp. EPa45]AKK26302.1 cyclase [Mycobacterium sp. EPa45]
MDRIWQWAWNRYGSRYSWALLAMHIPPTMLMYLLWSVLIVAIEDSSHYAEAAVVIVVGIPVVSYVTVLPGLGPRRVVERWAQGHAIDRLQVLHATYSWTRGVVVRTVAAQAVWASLSAVVIAAMAGASLSRIVQYGVLGVATGFVVGLTAAHNLEEATVRPIRAALSDDSDIGDSLPRSRPTFAAWSSVFMLGVGFVFATIGGMSAAVLYRLFEEPVVFCGIAVALTLVFGIPITVGIAFAPSLRPIRDLAEGTKRVAAGDYSQRLPVVQDDDLGALAASFNRMQSGLAERQRLQAAFGTYVDPALATKLLEQGDDVFTGERREVTVMFVDVRDFTPFAEANPAEDVVARLNALFDIVVPAVVDGGGHVNKFLGDGALAVFGAPNELANHADAAVEAAVLIERRVAERFQGELRIGIGINTGVVVAGTIGGGSHLEFTLIGDTTNVAARVEQLTKATGNAILLTGQTVDALSSRPPDLIDRGSHALKGKSAAVQVFGLSSTGSISK